MTEHIFDQLTKAQAREQQALEKARQLIQQFHEVVQKLQNMFSVNFEWHDADGTLHRTQSPDQNTIYLDRVPSLEIVRDAIMEWREQIGLVNGIKDNLSDDQRKTLGLPPR